MSPRRRLVLLASAILLCAGLIAAAVARAAAVASFTSAPAAPPPHTVDFDASASTADDYSWNFGDGTLPTAADPSPTITHAFRPGAGSRRVTLTVTEANATPTTLDDTDSTSQTVAVPNNQPTGLTLGISSAGPFRTGQTISFATSSSDADLDPPSYTWDFGDGQTGTGTSPSHTYSVAGDYDVEVSVRDGYGPPVTRGRTITVQGPPAPPPPVDRPPTATATAAPLTPRIGQSVQFAAGASDPDGDALSYSWNFGDGTTSAAANPTHAYGSAGIRTVKLSVSDGRGGVAFDSLSIATQPPDNHAPTVVLNAVGGKVAKGQNVTLSAVATDPDRDPLTFFWSFGDGTTSTSANPTHRWSTSGTKDVKLTVRDPHGATDSDALALTVIGDDVPPVADFRVLPGRPRVGQEVTLASFAYDRDGRIREQRWDTNGDRKFAGGPTGQRVKIRFKRPGSHRLGLRVVDDRGVATTRFVTVRVRPRVTPPLDPSPVVRLRTLGSRFGQRVSVLSVFAPRGATVRVSCSGRSCRGRPARTASKGRRPLRFGSFEHFMPAGVLLEVRVTKRGFLGKYTSFRIRGRLRGYIRVDCSLRDGSSRPMRCR